MRESLQKLCASFAENRDVVKKTFRMESSYIYPVCANVFCAKGLTADPERLDACKRLLKDKTGVFSNFRGNLRAPVVSMLAAGGSPETRLDRALSNYSMLKDQFMGSEYLALAAFLLTELGAAGSRPETAGRAKAIYRRMRKEHPFLTSSEDSVFAVFLAFSEKSDDDLVEDIEACYSLLRKVFPVSNDLQTVSHVLSLGQGSPEEKAGRLCDLYDAVRAAGGKYGKHYELSTLAALSLLEGEIPEMAADMMEIDAFLSAQKGYGPLSIDRKTRLMHAAMLAGDEYSARQELTAAALTPSASGTALQNVALTGTLAILAAQQAAMCAMIASSSVAASTAAH